MILVARCHTVIHIIFLKPLYVPNIFATDFSGLRKSGYLFAFNREKKKDAVCYAFIRQESGGTFRWFQIATVVTINPRARIENNRQDTARVPLKGDSQPQTMWL